MEAKELMIDDWVRGTSGVVGRVKGISENDVLIKTVNGDTWADGEILPIPLTPEILERNGFRFDDSDTGDLEYYCLGEPGEESTVVVKRRGLLALEDADNKSGEVVWCMYVEDLDVYDKILYVHTLQHALRLSEIDKEIVL